MSRPTAFLTLLTLTLISAAIVGRTLAFAAAAAPSQLQPRAIAPLLSADTIPPSDLPTRMVTLRDGDASGSLTVELAVTDKQRQRGLMFRTILPDSEGMLFVFSRDNSGAFWMKDTYIPLDIAWIDASGVVLGIAYGQPLDLTGLEPPSPYRFVLEVAGGWFERHNMAAGAVVQLPADLVPPDAP